MATGLRTGAFFAGLFLEGVLGGGRRLHLFLDLDRLGVRLDGDGEVLDLLGGLAAPGPHGLLAVLGDLLVRLPRLDGVLGGDTDTAQGEVLGGLAELLQVGVEGAEELRHLGLKGLLRLLGAGGGLLLDGVGVDVLHGVDAARGLGADLLHDAGDLLRLLNGQVGGAGEEVEGVGSVAALRMSSVMAMTMVLP